MSALKSQLKAQKQSERVVSAYENLEIIARFISKIICTDLSTNKDIEIISSFSESIFKFKEVYKYSKNSDIKKLVKIILGLLEDIKRNYESLIQNLKLYCSYKNKSILSIIKIKKTFIIDYFKEIDPIIKELYAQLNYGLRAEGIIDDNKSSKTNMTLSLS